MAEKKITLSAMWCQNLLSQLQKRRPRPDQGCCGLYWGFSFLWGSIQDTIEQGIRLEEINIEAPRSTNYKKEKNVFV